VLLLMYSGNQLRRSVRAAVGCVVLVPFLGLTACTGEISSHPNTSALSSAPTPSVAHDGRTILATPGITACQVIGPDAIRQHLGTRAAGLQAEQSSGVQDAEGVKKESCIYPLDERGLTTNAVIVEATTYPSATALAGADPFELMTAPEDVSGLGDRAKFGMNSLSGTNEFVLTVVSGIRVTRLLIAVPSSAVGWDKSSGKDIVLSLARDAKF
jgi:hypothetical protein